MRKYTIKYRYYDNPMQRLYKKAKTGYKTIKASSPKEAEEIFMWKFTKVLIKIHEIKRKY